MGIARSPQARSFCINRKSSKRERRQTVFDELSDYDHLSRLEAYTVRCGIASTGWPTHLNALSQFYTVFPIGFANVANSEPRGGENATSENIDFRLFNGP